jgi:hypothetical protein
MFTTGGGMHCIMAKAHVICKITQVKGKNIIMFVLGFMSKIIITGLTTHSKNRAT